jgi:DNA modification methylase
MNKLICCDAVVGLKPLPDESIPLVVTSPPWDNMRKYGGHQWTFGKFETIADHLWRVIRQGGVVCWHVADQVKDCSETLTSFRQALHFRQLGFVVNTLVIDSHTPGARKYRYGFTGVQYVFVLSKGCPQVFQPICDVPNKTAGEIGRMSRRNADGEIISRVPRIVKAFRSRGAVWHCQPGSHCDKDLIRSHPAVFNEKLVRDLIRSFSVTGNVVLDCFSGAGTTAMVALIEGRRYLGFEIHRPYHELAVERLRRTSARLVA